MDTITRFNAFLDDEKDYHMKLGYVDSKIDYLEEDYSLANRMIQRKVDKLAELKAEVSSDQAEQANLKLTIATLKAKRLDIVKAEDLKNNNDPPPKLTIQPIGGAGLVPKWDSDKPQAIANPVLKPFYDQKTYDCIILEKARIMTTNQHAVCSVCNLADQTNPVVFKGINTFLVHAIKSTALFYYLMMPKGLLIMVGLQLKRG